MSDTNVSIISGRIVKDPVVKAIGNDNSVCNFSIASTRKFKEKEDTTFLDCEAFGNLAKNIGKFLTKGRKVLLQGRLAQDKWEDVEGNKRSKTVLKVDDFSFLDSAK